MSDPFKEFENKLKDMSLRELQDYKRRLDERIKQKISANEPNETVAPLILYRGVLEYEIKSRTVS